MTQITVEIPNDLAQRLRPVQNRLPEIIEIGLREVTSSKSYFQNEIIDFLANGPSPEEIVSFRPSEKSIERAQELLEKNQAGRLSPAEKNELDHYEQMNYLMTLVKARARKKLL